MIVVSSQSGDNTISFGCDSSSTRLLFFLLWSRTNRFFFYYLLTLCSLPLLSLKSLFASLSQTRSVGWKTNPTPKTVEKSHNHTFCIDLCFEYQEKRSEKNETNTYSENERYTGIFLFPQRYTVVHFVIFKSPLLPVR